MVCTAATDTQHRYALPEHRYFTLRAIRQAVTAAVSAACGNRDSDCPEIQKAALSAASYSFGFLERAMRFELTTPTLARLCSTPELRPLTRLTGVRPRLYGARAGRMQQAILMHRCNAPGHPGKGCRCGSKPVLPARKRHWSGVSWPRPARSCSPIWTRSE